MIDFFPGMVRIIIEEPMVKLSFVILCAVLLTACAKEAPKCSEPSTLALVKRILLDEMGADAEAKKLIDSYISFENTRPSAFDEKIKKFSCEATMSVRGGGEGSGSYSVPIEFESQLDDKGEHIVAVTKLLPGDQRQLVAHLSAALAHAKPAPAATGDAPQDNAADAAAVSETATPGDTTATVETEGVCQGLDLAVTIAQSECIGRKFAIADKQLNEDYRRLMGSLSPERQAELKASQRAWIREKNRACEEAGKEAEGGTLQPILIGDCTVRMTEERIAFLARFR